MNRCYLAPLILISLLGTVGGAAGIPPQDVYREAVLQETTNRNLDKAISLYEQLIQMPGASPSLLANGYLRLGSCYRQQGQPDRAKNAWSKVVSDYPDQTAPYQEARLHLQELEAESQKAAAVQTSSSAAARPELYTRLEFLLLNFGYLSSHGENSIFGYPSISYFYKPNRSIGMEASRFDRDFNTLAESFEETTLVDTTYVAVTHRWEKPVWGLFRPYLKIGPAAYHFHASDFTGDTQAWGPGVVMQAGVTLGNPRGFVLALGYGLDAYYQPHLLNDLGSGLFGVPVAQMALGYRW